MYGIYMRKIKPENEARVLLDRKFKPSADQGQISMDMIESNIYAIMDIMPELTMANFYRLRSFYQQKFFKEIRAFNENNPIQIGR